jgi:hypothetical protein
MLCPIGVEYGRSEWPEGERHKSHINISYVLSLMCPGRHDAKGEAHHTKREAVRGGGGGKPRISIAPPGPPPHPPAGGGGGGAPKTSHFNCNGSVLFTFPPPWKLVLRG